MTHAPAKFSEEIKISEAVALFASGAKVRSYSVIDATGHLIGLALRSTPWREMTMMLWLKPRWRTPFRMHPNPMSTLTRQLLS